MIFSNGTVQVMDTRSYEDKNVKLRKEENAGKISSSFSLPNLQLVANEDDDTPPPLPPSPDDSPANSPHSSPLPSPPTSPRDKKVHTD
jgi:hypothetical protein